MTPDYDDDSNTHWFYKRCSTARVAMETPLSALRLSIKLLQFLKCINEDTEDISQIELFNVLKGDDIQAKKRDLSFVYDICERAIELRDDEEFSEEALQNVAKECSDDGGGDNDDGALEGTNNATKQGNEENDETDAPASSMNDQPTTKENGNNNGDLISNKHGINFDELHCFQLRTRVLGLNIPSFKVLWKYLQIAGWTWSGGIYHIPKGERSDMKYGIEGMSKKIYKHFNIIIDPSSSSQKNDVIGEEESNDEEGPKSFTNSNDLVNYLDEYCMPDYRATSAEIRAQETALSAKSNAYKRRNIRLRFELLEVAYRERTGQTIAGNNNTKSKYGHNHRPCDVCFKGANRIYPRVACRDCGLVVHTHCYGLLDHGENSSVKKGSGGALVDEKGLFTCDVCSQTVTNGKSGVRWNASQSSGWRYHEHPNAICPLCNRKDIAGGMVRIVVDEESSTGGGAKMGNNKRKRKSRQSGESTSETYVHLFCLNSLQNGTISPRSVRSSSSVIAHIGDGLDRAAEVLKETESKQERTIRCGSCEKRKGDLIECKGSCRVLYHSLCLQIDLMNVADWNSKKEHKCLICRNGGAPNDADRSFPVSSLPRVGPPKTNAHKQSKSTTAKKEKSIDEVEQYFSHNKTGRKKKDEATKSEVVIPSHEEVIAEVESLHRQSNADDAFDKFELQYQQEFYEWSFSMATNQSILLYGVGSKISLLTSFGRFLAQEGDVISLNGYDPSIDMGQFLDYMNKLFCGGGDSQQQANPPERDPRKGLAKKAASIAKAFASKRDRPLFLLIHNIDGTGLCNIFSQDVIAALTSNSKKDGSQLIRVVASVDNVNASMVLWSPQVEHKFNWAWKKVHSYRPYIEEVRYNTPQSEVSKKSKKQKGGIQSRIDDGSALKVLAYLAPRHTEALQALASLQLSNSLKSISYATFRDECIKKMLTSSDMNLRNILKELSDHKIVGTERDKEGNEMVFVPSGIPIHDILNYKLI